jgi:hypothetical protein
MEPSDIRTGPQRLVWTARSMTMKETAMSELSLTARLARAIVVTASAGMLAALGAAPAHAFDPQPNPAPTRSSADRPAPSTSVPGSRAGHRVPAVPLAINGSPVAGSAITQYDGRPLYMAAVPGSANFRLMAFTGRADFERFVNGHGGPAHVLARVPSGGSALPGPGFAVTYQHINSSGASLQINAGESIPALTDINMSCTWFTCKSWNDQISSVYVTPDTAHGLLLYEHVNFAGSVLWTPAATRVQNLRQLGWNDVASSIYCY